MINWKSRNLFEWLKRRDYYYVYDHHFCVCKTFDKEEAMKMAELFWKLYPLGWIHGYIGKKSMLQIYLFG